MPHCYLIALAAGSSLDQHSNNVTLFNLVEQVNVPTGVNPTSGSRIPLEIHAYIQLSITEVGKDFEMRFALVSSTGLETFTEPKTHRALSSRMRTRLAGVPFPPILGHYELKVDFKAPGTATWTRDSAAWPIAFLHADEKPPVTH